MALVAYAAAAAFREAAMPSWAFASLIPIGIGLAWMWRVTAPVGTGPAEDARKPLLSASRAAATGIAVTLFGLVAPHLAGPRAALALGAGIASAAGLYALGRARGRTGILAEVPVATTQALVLSVLGFAGAFVLASRTALLGAPPFTVRTDHPLDAYLVSAGGLGSLALFVVLAIQARRARRLELGAPERLTSFAWLAGTMVAASAALGGLGFAPTEVVLPIASALAGGLACAVATARDPEALGRFAARILAVATLAGPPALGAGALLRALPWAAVEITVAGAALAAVGGALAGKLAARLGPVTDPWVHALEAARVSAMRPDPDEAIERALFELRALVAGGRRSPLLVRLAPPIALTVDRAGYAQSTPILVPLELARVTSEEPEQVLRREVAEEASVRRADARPALAWMAERDLGTMALLRDGDLPIGLLCLPSLEREGTASAAEVRALRELADRLGAALAASARIARALEREDDLRRAGAALEERHAELQKQLADDRDRSEALARTVAERAKLAVYSPAARATAEAIDRIATRGEPLALLVPAGVDALPFAAQYHLTAPRRGGGIHVLDGARAELAPIERWRDAEASPLVAARGGTLVITDPQRLPRPIQTYLAASLDDTLGLVVVVPRTVDVLVASGDLEERLADVLGDRTVAVPGLAARAEDLRALALHHLTRAGIAYRGRPLGIDAAALALLIEHTWPGNDAELESLLVRAALDAGGDVVTKADLVRAGFIQDTTAADPVSGSRRPRARAV
jgi:hypothetical protein